MSSSSASAQAAADGGAVNSARTCFHLACARSVAVSEPRSFQVPKFYQSAIIGSWKAVR